VCGGLPTEAVPNNALSGLAFSHAIRPVRSFAGTAFLARIRTGLLASKAIGSKSLTTS
jgi:hypothetical protein